MIYRARRRGRRHGGQRLLVTALSSCMSIGCFLLTPLRKFYQKWRTLIRNSGFLAKKTTITTKVRSFFRSVALKRRKDHVISQDTGEKTPTYIVEDIDSTFTIAKSGDFTADHRCVDDAHKGLLIPQDLSLGEKSEKLPQKRPQDIDAAEPLLVHKSPPAKKRQKYRKRRTNIKSCQKQDVAVKGDVSFLNTETIKTLDKKASGEAPIVSHKRKELSHQDSQPGTFPPAKKAAVETSTKYYGIPELGTPQVEIPDPWRQQNINNLSPEQLSILKSKGVSAMLDDDIINMAQELLQCQFLDFDGLQPAAALLVPGYSVLKKAVQIHYDEERVHWLTTCFKNGDILVADSIKTKNLPPSICEQITNIYSAVVDEPLNHLKFLKVDQQRNNYDCGVFAIAFAFELLAEDGEPTAIYQHRMMREHLISCLKNGRISGFPKMVK